VYQYNYARDVNLNASPSEFRNYPCISRNNRLLVLAAPTYNINQGASASGIKQEILLRKGVPTGIAISITIDQQIRYVVC
jgi:hypothetical protein